MLLEPKSSHKKILLSVVFVVLLLGVAAFIASAMRKEVDTTNNSSTIPSRVSLEGTYICLPYKSNAPVENRICDFGLRTADGVLYSLDFNLMSQSKPELKTGDMIKANGIVTLVETLSSDYFTKRYDITGIFSITDSLDVTHVDDTTSNGIITFSRPSGFGLALNTTQILVSSYIPPCDSSFDYCLYYNGNEYTNTNFGSAGVRIKKREDLTSSNSCLNTAPTGFANNKPTKIATTSAYAISQFSTGDAGAGHYASGELYRLAYNNTCHEFETRISASQFGNYPEGTIDLFVDTELRTKLKQILNNIELSGGTKLTF